MESRTLPDAFQVPYSFLKDVVIPPPSEDRVLYLCQKKEIPFLRPTYICSHLESMNSTQFAYNTHNIHIISVSKHVPDQFHTMLLKKELIPHVTLIPTQIQPER